MKDRMLVIRALTAAVAVVGVIMLISGILLRNLDEAGKTTPEKAQMPEEYIEEFFSHEDETPNIEDYMEPEWQN